MISSSASFVGALASLLLASAVCTAVYFQQQKELVRSQPVSVLIYETEEIQGDSPALGLKEQASRLNGVEATIFGSKQGFDGYGSKYAEVFPILKEMNEDRLVAIVDGRDVLVNNPAHSEKFLDPALKEFQQAYEELSACHPGAVVISAEAQCCVSALTHTEPGGYFNDDGTRKGRACASGEADCLWQGEDKALPWKTFMKELAIQRTGEDYDDVYLNAGLMAGKVKDLVRFIEATGIGKDEDDQAVFTDFMYANPEAVVLDYGQKMFGNNRWANGGMDDESCMFAHQESQDGEVATERLTHSKTLSTPLFLHSPGGFLECHDVLADKLGVKAVSKVVRRRLKQDKRALGCNYGGNCLENALGGILLENGDGAIMLGIDIELPDWARETD